MATYIRSRLLTREEIEEYGCFTTLDIRISNYEAEMNAACFKAYHTWRTECNMIIDEQRCYDPIHNALALATPECLPERIQPLADMMEVTLLQDDIIDDLDSNEARALNADWADGSALYPRTQEMADRQRRKKQMEARVMLDVIATDREQGLRILGQWKKLYRDAHGTKDLSSFKTLESFLDYRFYDVGTEVTYEICCWAQGFMLSESEKESVQHVARPASQMMFLTNDYHSFNKELATYQRRGGTKGISNTVWILMHLHGISVEEARLKLKELIIKTEQDYIQKRRELETSGQRVSEKVWRYIDAAQWFAIGSWYWSTFCGRYNRYLDTSGQNGYDWIVKLDPMNSETLSYAVDKLNPSAKNLGDVHVNPYLSSTKSGFNGSSKAETDLDDRLVLTHGYDDIAIIDDKIISAPYNYLLSLPSKGVRNRAIEALNVWYTLPDNLLNPIKNIITLLHSSSLMLDDIEDHSALRRGRPSTHIIFGEPQTINSANYLFAQALVELQELRGSRALSIFTSELRNLHLGQSMDLYWTYTITCPSEIEYLSMVDGKTGGLFRMLGRLMEAESTLATDLKIENFTTLVGRYFQIRDDYLNLCSPDYASQKGFCEDLDEGKFSLALIHVLQNSPDQLMLEALLQQRKQKGRMTFEMKCQVLEQMDACGSLTYVRQIILELEVLIIESIEEIEKTTGSKNWILRLLVETLKLD